MKKNTIITIILCVLTAIIVHFFCNYNQKITTKIETRIDTITITKVVPDTIYKINTKVVYLPKTEVVYKATKPDTITTTDSVLVAVPIYKYNFHKDSLYNIEASGYDVKLENVELYNRTKTITIEKIQYKKPRFGVGVHAGYGIGKNGLQPYLGIGINYNILNIK